MDIAIQLNSKDNELNASLNSTNNELNASLNSTNNELNASLNNQIVKTIVVGGNTYNSLNDKPSINGVELTGDKSSSEIGIEFLSNTELESLLKL